MSKLSFEIKRKFFHVAIIGYLLIYISILNLAHSKILSILALSIILLAFLILEYFRIHNRRNIPLFNSLWRKNERKKLGGEIYYMLGVILVVAFFKFEIALAAVLMTTFGDTAGAIFGVAFGKKKIPGSRTATFEGSFAELIINIIVGCIILFGSWAIAIPMALTATLAEVYSGKIDDNLLVPVFSGLIGTIISIL